MALLYKIHIQGDSDNTTPFPHITISSCKLQLAEISTTATYVYRDGCLGISVVLSLPPCMIVYIFCRPVPSLQSVDLYEIIL